MTDGSANELRAETLAYVTRHMSDLQGMRAAPLLVLVPLWCTYFYRYGTRSKALHALLFQALTSLLFSLLLAWFGAVAFQRYYRARYGEVHAFRPVLGSSGMTHLAIYNAPEQAIPAQMLERDQAGRPILILAAGLAFVSTIIPSHHHSSSHFPFFLWAVFFLIPRLSTRTSANFALRARRWLTIFTIAFFFALFFDFQWGSLSVPAYIDAMAGSALFLVVYDHWLLGHLLPRARRGPTHG